MIWPRHIFKLVLVMLLVTTYLIWVSEHQKVVVAIAGSQVTLPLPVLAQPRLMLRNQLSVPEPTLDPAIERVIENERQQILTVRRQSQINKVEALFAKYNSPMKGYGHILVDQSEKCGGDYRVLVGIAGSESGLGRIMYKKYNPFGYLNKVQYSSLEEALTYLSCQISRQHIARCGTDLQCLYRRYAGPQDDAGLFMGKVRTFMKQLEAS